MDPAGAFLQVPDSGERPVHLQLAAVGLRHDPCDGAAVARDDKRFTPLYFIKELGEMHFRFRGLNLAHNIN